MITKETCELIWHCYREIEAGENLLADIKETIDKNWHNNDAQKLKDVFGHGRDLQLGIPNGQASHRLFSLSFTLAEPVIRAHIANKRAHLAELQERAKVELSGGAA
jgi:hypothetical protein